MKIDPAPLSLVITAALIPAVGAAHHSRVEFTYGAMHEVEGEAVRVVWRNPHVMITVRSETADGTVQDWILEGPGAGTLRHDGLVDGYVKQGDRVRAAGQRSDRREYWLRLAHVLPPSGTELVFTSSGPRWSDDFIGASQVSEAEVAEVAEDTPPEGIFRVWSWTGGTPYEIDEQPPLTPEAMAAYQAFDPLQDDPVLECVLPGMPRVTTIAGSRPIEFEQRGEDILLHAQNYNQTRVIHMGAEIDASEVEATPLGYSQGRWEGDTLVVTTNRISYPFFDIPPWWGIPQSEQVEIVERITLEGDTLVYDFWANDPANFTAPIEKPRFFVWTWRAGLEVETDHCEPYFEEP